jgi:hypothetical protein
MSTASVVTQGTLFQIGSGTTPESFHTIAEVKGFSGLGGGSATVIDVTHFLSTSKEKKLGFADQGTMSIDLNFVPTDVLGQQVLETLRRTGAARNFRLTMTDGTIANLSGLVKTFAKTAATDDIWRATVDLEVSGEPVWTYAA